MKRHTSTAYLPWLLWLLATPLHAQLSERPGRIDGYDWIEAAQDWALQETHIYQYDKKGRTLNEYILNARGDTSMQVRYAYKRMRRHRTQQQRTLLDREAYGEWGIWMHEKRIYDREGNMLEYEQYIADSLRQHMYLDYREKTLLKVKRQGRFRASMKLAAQRGQTLKPLVADTFRRSRKGQDEWALHYGPGLAGLLSLITSSHTVYDAEGRMLTKETSVYDETGGVNEYKEEGQAWARDGAGYKLSYYMGYQKVMGAWLPGTQVNIKSEGRSETVTARRWDNKKDHWANAAQNLTEKDSMGSTVYSCTWVGDEEDPNNWLVVLQNRSQYQYDARGRILSETKQYAESGAPLLNYERTVYSQYPEKLKK